MPLCTMSQWGWHTQPAPGIQNQQLRLTAYDTYGRSVGYQTSSEGQTELYNWLRENPHRLHLGRIGLALRSGRQIEPSDLSDIDQELNLWDGILVSRFKLLGVPVVVRTAVHPQFSRLAVSIQSPAIGRDRIAVRLVFPYGSSKMQAADWNQGARHQTTLVSKTGYSAQLERKLDGEKYFVALRWDGECELKEDGAHSFLLTERYLRTHRLDFIVAFTQRSSYWSFPSAEPTFAVTREHWNRFWSSGGAVELANSRDRRAGELERRVVLSQYLTAIQCAGSLPPQETGLTVNSWYGKFHLEMHWWHAAHFALWNRLPLLEKSLRWYEEILPSAQARAKSQGYSGARWPKMVGPEGRDSPSAIGPLLIWQQPHPLFYAELCYQAHPDRATLERYREVVFQTAEFMRSFAFFDSTKQRYVLGPPVIPAQENHPPRETWNPTFELGYWKFGLTIAQRWRQRLGLKRNDQWDQVIEKLSALPVRDGVYLAHENCPETYSARYYDHPSMLGALGILPGTGVDRETMRRTLNRVIKEWKWDQTWGWDYPMTAMTAARLGETTIAVDALLMETEKNRYLPNGHNWQRRDLPCYLPGNGGLLYAVGMMARGWPGSPATQAPGFPSDGSWNVRWENLVESVA